MEENIPEPTEAPADPQLRVVPKPEGAVEVTKAAPGSLREGMRVTLVWQDKDKKTWIHPAIFYVKGVWKNGRVNLKVVKR
jgi:hypothetical protein